MLLAAPATAFVAALCVLSASAQQNNYVDDGNFDYAEPAPRAAPRPAPAYRPNTLSTAAKPTPVPILKQINRHNEDGSYTYGYEGADGSFKIETKLANGEVMGKYGYVDDNGKVRVVEYGANKYGFQPAGEGITVAPPTLVDETATKKPKHQQAGQGRLVENAEPEYDDGQYYEEPRVAPTPAPRRSASRPRPTPTHHAAPQPQYNQQPQYTPQAAPQPQYTPQAAPQPQFSSQDTFSSFSSSQTFGPSRPVSAGPVPPRAAIPGAAPAGPVPARAAVSGAAPVGPPPSFAQGRSLPPSQPAYRPAQQQFFAPAPVYETRAAPAPARAAPSRSSYGRSGGILDQLEKDFALPSSHSPALHDITFGSY